jgi:hypothetical protein
MCLNGGCLPTELEIIEIVELIRENKRKRLSDQTQAQTVNYPTISNYPIVIKNFPKKLSKRLIFSFQTINNNVEFAIIRKQFW